MDEVTGEATPQQGKSLQLRFVATVAGLMLLLTSVIVVVTVRSQSSTSRADLEQRVTATAELVAIDARNGSARGDAGALRAIGEFLRNQDGVTSAHVLDADGTIVANDTIDADLIGTVLDDPSGAIAAAVAGISPTAKPTVVEYDGDLVVAQPILVDGQHVRTITFNASLDEVSSEVRSVLVRGLLLGTMFMLLGVFVTNALMKRITRPLQEITDAAEHLSQIRLPALVQRMRVDASEDDVDVLEYPEIVVHSNDEIGRLADAFNSIQATATSVATEQGELLNRGISDIFVQLARRNQSLIDRQIEVIDSLEESERSPDALAGLFKLDHLAARMRRNAESLLVLAGESQTNVRARPSSMTDVMRVAVGEVEQYHRVEVLEVAPIMVKGAAASGMAHLLAELLDNALRNSPEATRVNVRGEGHGNGHYVIEISDQGVGLNSDQLAEYNKHLANPPKMGLSLSSSLGFTVVGRLAKQFDARVVLRPSAGGGLSAFVRIPSSQLSKERRRPARDGAEAPAAAAQTEAPPAAKPEVERRTPKELKRREVEHPTPVSVSPPIEELRAPMVLPDPMLAAVEAPDPSTAVPVAPPPASVLAPEPIVVEPEPAVAPVTSEPIVAAEPVAAPAVPTPAVPSPAAPTAAVSTPPVSTPPISTEAVPATPVVTTAVEPLPTRQAAPATAPPATIADLPKRVSAAVEPTTDEAAAAPPLPTRRSNRPAATVEDETGSGQPLPGRTPVTAPGAASPAGREGPSRQRSPEELRRMLNSYRRGQSRTRPDDGSTSP